MAPIICRGPVAHFLEIKQQCLDLIARLGISQIAVQIRHGEPSWSQGTGWLDSDPQELDYQELHPELRGTALDQYLQSLGTAARRTRIMTLAPGQNYSLHRDPRPRLHLPIQTNPGARFLFPMDSVPQTLLEGYLYSVDTSRLHTAQNLGTVPRIHLVTVDAES